MEPMEPEPRVEKPKPRSPQSPKRTKAPEKRAPVSNCPPPPLEPVPIDAHPFVADAPRIHATYAADDEGAFTSLALRCIRARRCDVSSKRGSRKGKSRRGPKGSGASDETAPATRFADADDYAAYHRLLVLEDCASGAHDEFNLNTGAGRTMTRWKVQSGFTSVAALTAMSSIEGLATVVLTRDRKAEKNGSTGNFPTTDDVVELRLGNGKEECVVLGIVADAHPDGNSASAYVCADDLLGASALTRGAAVSVKVGYSLTTTRREFHAVQNTVTRLHAPLVAPLLLGQPLYVGWNNDSTLRQRQGGHPRHPRKGEPAPVDHGHGAEEHPRRRARHRHVAPREFNANQADAIRRCVSPGALGPDTPETVRPCMGVALLHGPPGTGKTNTLVGVVSALLMCLPKPRILLCAPSNAAIDELALRVFKGRLDATGAAVGMKAGELVRVGPIDQVSHRMQPHALNTLVDAQMERMMGRRKEEDAVRKMVVNAAQVVAATTSAAGGAYLTQSGVGFDCVIIDEAAQASEAATLVPLAHSGGNKGETLGAKRLVLVGDHMQLPAMAHAADQNLKRAYAASLFERLETSHPAVALTGQHRMHADIARWPARYFYRGELTNAADAPTESPFVESLGLNGDGCVCVDGRLVRLKSYAFLDFHGEEGVGAASKSIMNESEAKVVATVVKAARRWARSGASVAVITPYREQRDLIVKHVDDVSVRVGTVDGFQGQEADIVVISCTRTKQLGFLEDERRLNVALTRARECLLIVGSADFMREKSGPWKELVDDAAQRNCLHPVVPAGPGHVNGQSVSTPDYDARVLETKVETQERTPNVIKRDRGGDRNVRERSPEPSGPRRVVVVRKRARTPERQAGHRQPREQPGQQQRRRVVVNTSPAQKRRELEDKARRELQDKLVVKAKLDEQRRRRLERERRDRRGGEQRGGDDLRGRLGKSDNERNNRRPDDDDRWEWR